MRRTKCEKQIILQNLVAKIAKNRGKNAISYQANFVTPRKYFYMSLSYFVHICVTMPNFGHVEDYTQVYFVKNIYFHHFNVCGAF